MRRHVRPSSVFVHLKSPRPWNGGTLGVAAGRQAGSVPAGGFGARANSYGCHLGKTHRALGVRCTYFLP